jgi:putative oxidoreductase
MSKNSKNRLVWALQILLSLAFLAAGGSKLAGLEPMVKMFNSIGFGQWFRYLTGATEVLAAIFLIIPSLVGLGGLIIVCTMIVATFTHLFLIGGSPVPAIVLGLLGSVVFILRRDRLGPLQAIFPIPSLTR